MSKNSEIPIEVLDLVRFMCETWLKIDHWAYNNCDPELLIKYPVIQGTNNQLNLLRIGGQKYKKDNIKKAVDWMINNEIQN